MLKFINSLTTSRFIIIEHMIYINAVSVYRDLLHQNNIRRLCSNMTSQYICFVIVHPFNGCKLQDRFMIQILDMRYKYTAFKVATDSVSGVKPILLIHLVALRLNDGG